MKVVQQMAAYSGEVLPRGNTKLKTQKKVNSMKDFLTQMVKPPKPDSYQLRREFQPTVSRFCEINSNGAKEMIIVP